MARIVRSDESESDILKIAHYIARNNPSAAFNLIDTIDDVLAMLSASPGLGQSRDDLAPSVRMFPAVII